MRVSRDLCAAQASTARPDERFAVDQVPRAMDTVCGGRGRGQWRLNGVALARVVYAYDNCMV